MKTYFSPPLLGGFFIILVLLSSCSSKKVSPDVLLWVDGEPVKISELIEEYRFSRPFKDISVTNDSEFLWDPTLKDIREKILQKVVEKKILLKLAEKKNINISDRELKNRIAFYTGEMNGVELERLLYRANIDKKKWITKIKEEMIIRNYLEKYIFSQITVTPKDVKKYYDDNKSQFKLKEGMKLISMLFKTRLDAEKALKEIKNKETFINFSNKEYHDNYNESVVYYKNDIPKNIWDILVKYKKGSISKIIFFNGGYYIFYIEDKFVPKELSFDEVKEKIAKRCLERKKDSYYKNWLENLKKTTKIRINKIYRGKL